MKVLTAPRCVIDHRQVAASQARRSRASRQTDEPGSDPEALILARLWLEISVKSWGARRQCHLLLARPLERASPSEPWLELDLAHYPLRLSSKVTTEDEQALLARSGRDLLARLARASLVLYRMSRLDLVSELGETRDELRKRAMAALRPGLQSQIRSSAAELARDLPGLLDSIEELHLSSVGEMVRQLELCVLEVGRGIRIESLTRPSTVLLGTSPDANEAPQSAV